MNFGHAIEALKGGLPVRRAGWKEGGMFLFLVPGQFDGPYRGFAPGAEIEANHPSTQDGISLSLFEPERAGAIPKLPCIGMRTETGAILHGWCASQSDMLAEDWTI